MKKAITDFKLLTVLSILISIPLLYKGISGAIRNHHAEERYVLTEAIVSGYQEVQGRGSNRHRTYYSLTYSYTVEGEVYCLFGIKNTAIYVTYPVADNQTLLRHTLEHEATHHRHGDHIWAVLCCVCLESTGTIRWSGGRHIELHRVFCFNSGSQTEILEKLPAQLSTSEIKQNFNQFRKNC